MEPQWNLHHIPFPPPEILTALPNHEHLIPAMCYYDLIGFQTEIDAANFAHYLQKDVDPHTAAVGLCGSPQQPTTPVPRVCEPTRRCRQFVQNAPLLAPSCRPVALRHRPSHLALRMLIRLAIGATSPIR
jgi:hypothetical protein